MTNRNPVLLLVNNDIKRTHGFSAAILHFFILIPLRRATAVISEITSRENIIFVQIFVSDSNGICTHSHLVRNRTLNHLARLVCVASLAKWLSVRLRTKWLWVRIQLQYLKLQILRLFQARS